MQLLTRIARTDPSRDDPVRKLPVIESVKEYKKRVVLEEEKSNKSLVNLIEEVGGALSVFGRDGGSILFLPIPILYFSIQPIPILQKIPIFTDTDTRTDTTKLYHYLPIPISILHFSIQPMPIPILKKIPIFTDTDPPSLVFCATRGTPK